MCPGTQSPWISFSCDWPRTSFTAVAVVHLINCIQLYEPKHCSSPVFPVLHSLPEFAQIHVHWVSDAIQSSHPLSLPSPFAFNLSQDQGSFPIIWFFTSGGQNIGTSASASFLLMNIHCILFPPFIFKTVQPATNQASMFLRATTRADVWLPHVLLQLKIYTKKLWSLLPHFNFSKVFPI